MSTFVSLHPCLSLSATFSCPPHLNQLIFFLKNSFVFASMPFTNSLLLPNQHIPSFLHRYCTILQHACLTSLIFCFIAPPSSPNFTLSAWGSSSDIITPTVTMVSGKRDRNNCLDQTGMFSASASLTHTKRGSREYREILFIIGPRHSLQVCVKRLCVREVRSVLTMALCERTSRRRTGLHPGRRPLL